MLRLSNRLGETFVSPKQSRIDEAKEWFRNTEEMMQSLSMYPTGEKLEDVHWRTLISNKDHRGGTPSEEFGRAYQRFLQLLNRPYSIYTHIRERREVLDVIMRLKSSESTTAGDPGMASEDQEINHLFEDSYALNGAGRNFFITKRGYVGMGPRSLMQHDQICLFLGAATPFVVRMVDCSCLTCLNATQHHKLVGECYVHGLMLGEGLSMGEERDIFLH